VAATPPRNHAQGRENPGITRLFGVDGEVLWHVKFSV